MKIAMTMIMEVTISLKIVKRRVAIVLIIVVMITAYSLTLKDNYLIKVLV